MKKLLVMTRIWLINSLSERGDMLLYTLSNCVAPLVTMFIWLSFTHPGQSSVFSYREIIWYFILVILVKLLTSSWAGVFLSNRIRRGAISPYLIQPMPYLYHYITNNIAEKIVKLIILIPILWFVPWWLNISLISSSISNLIFFVISTILAASIFFLIDMVIGLLGFWFEETSAIGDAYGLLGSLFSGVLIPLAALPNYLHNISLILPFRYTVSLPIEILLGRLQQDSLYLGLFLQATWLIVLIIAYKILWANGLKIYSATGA